MRIREIHSSQMRTYRTCPRMYRYQYVDKLQPRQVSEKLALGTLVHRGLGGYYLGEDPFTVYDSAFEELLDRLYERGSPPDNIEAIKADAELGRAMLRGYIAYAKQNDNFSMEAIEQPFRIPIRHYRSGRNVGAYLVGTFDGIAYDVWGRYWLKEFKTAAAFPSNTLLRLDEQSGYYLLGAVDTFPDWDFFGVNYTVIRKVTPERARTETIRRYKVLRNAYEIENLRVRLYWTWRKMQADDIYLPHSGQHCTWMCSYAPLCTAEEDGSDVDALIESLYVYAEPYGDLEEQKEVS